MPVFVSRFLGLVLLVLHGTLVGFFVLAFTSAYKPPDVLWWTELLAVGLPYLAFLLGPAALLAALMRRWRLAALHAGLLVLALLRFAPWSGWTPVEASDDTFSLLTFNAPQFSGGMPELTTSMEALAGSVDPDVFCLQEASVSYYPEAPPVRAAPYLAVLADSFGYQSVGPEADGPTYTPQPVFARLPIEGQTQTWMDAAEGRTRRTSIVRTVLEWQGRPFVLYNLHLYSFGARQPWRDEDADVLDADVWLDYLPRYRHAFAVRAAEAERIRTLLEREELPTLVCGDLNSTPYNWVYRHIAAGFQDAFREAGRGWGMTYHRRLPFARIDFILASDAFEIVSAEVAGGGLSDHRPVLARIRWSE